VRRTCIFVHEQTYLFALQHFACPFQIDNHQVPCGSSSYLMINAVDAQLFMTLTAVRGDRSKEREHGLCIIVHVLMY
jgi:hypothetical protein